jgi:hypothetical protein
MGCPHVGLPTAKAPEVKQPLMGLQQRAASVQDDVKDAVVKALPQGVPIPGELQSRGVQSGTVVRWSNTLLPVLTDFCSARCIKCSPFIISCLAAYNQCSPAQLHVLNDQE